MKYLRSSQIIPNQGMSYTYYETDEEDTIIRMLTHIPETGKIKCYRRALLKKVFAPERCETVTAKDFDALWQE